MKSVISQTYLFHPVPSRVGMPARQQRARLRLVEAACLGMLALGAQAQNYSILHHFTPDEGKAPGGLLLSGTTLYGLASSGGASNGGTIFKIDLLTSNLTVLKHFAGGPADGSLPVQTLWLTNETLYGITAKGGSKDCGTIFKVGTGGNQSPVLKSFAGPPDDGSDPSGLVLNGNILYGTTYSGGGSNVGTIFRLNLDDGGYAVLKHFTGSEPGTLGTEDGCYPRGRLAVSGRTLYGATVGGGRAGNGTIYRFDLDGGGSATLVEGDYTIGCHYLTGLLLSGTSLYGTCHSGGGGLGAVFRVSTTGSGYTILKTFTGFNGVNPNWLSLFGSKLYGCTDTGGLGRNGVVYQLNVDGSGDTCLREFDGSAGWGPSSVVMSGTTLYGTTYSGGAYNAGVIFALNLSPPNLPGAPVSQTVEQHMDARFSARAAGWAPLAYAWFFGGANRSGWSTNSSFVIKDADYSAAGSYQVVVTNLFGSVTSPAAQLNIIAPVDRWRVPALSVSAPVGNTVHLEHSEMLGPTANWIGFDSEPVSNSPLLRFDLSARFASQRYYRFWLTGQPGPAPVLGLVMAPGIVLTGPTGSLVRVDYINQFGPVDDWRTLATVQLTNITQVYVDSAAIGQPPRYWRVVPVP